MSRMINAFAVGALALSLVACAIGKAEMRAIGGEPRAISAAEDPFNMDMMAQLKPALVVSLRVTDRSIELLQAGMMLAPPQPNYSGESDRLVITALGPSGRVAQVVAGDAAEVIVEGAGTHRLEVRNISVAVPARQLIEKLEIANSAGASATFDVAEIMNGYCARAARVDPACRAAPG